MVNHTISLQNSRIIFVLFLLLGFLIPLPVLADDKLQNVDLDQDQVHPEYATGFSVVGVTQLTFIIERSIYVDSTNNIRASNETAIRC